MSYTYVILRWSRMRVGVLTKIQNRLRPPGKTRIFELTKFTSILTKFNINTDEIHTNTDDIRVDTDEIHEQSAVRRAEFVPGVEGRGQQGCRFLPAPRPS